MYRENLKRRNKWIAQFIEPVRAAAEEPGDCRLGKGVRVADR